MKNSLMNVNFLTANKLPNSLHDFQLIFTLPTRNRAEQEENKKEEKIFILDNGFRTACISLHHHHHPRTISPTSLTHDLRYFVHFE
jgi:predicted AAA+ superfamily ATPase